MYNQVILIYYKKNKKNRKKMTPLSKNLELISSVSSTKKQLGLLKKFCQESVFIDEESRNLAIKVFSEIQSKIEKNRNITKLKEQSSQLAKISEVFLSHCKQEDVVAVKQNARIQTWAAQVKKRAAPELWFQGGKPSTSLKRTGAEAERFLIHKKRIEAILPQETELGHPIGAFSLKQLLSIQKELKELLTELPLEDTELQQLWWHQYLRLLPALQHKSVECGDSDSSLPTRTFENETDAAGVFALMNLGALDLSGYNPARTSASYALSLTIQALERASLAGEVPEEEETNVYSLLQNYKAGYRVSNLQEKALTKARSAQTVEAAHACKKQVKAAILKELEESEALMLDVGYQGTYEGHAMTLYLSLNEGEDGVKRVTGMLINRGEGVSLHGGESVQGSRERVASFLNLGDIALQDLADSNFLDLLTELQFPQIPGSHTFTSYTIEDFYESVLPEWPGKRPAEIMSQKLRGKQRGGVCVLKASLTPMGQMLPPELTRFIKLKMRIETLELYLSHSQITAADIPHLQWSLKKIHRTLRKLEAQSQDETFPACLRQPLAQEARFCLSLSRNIETRIETLKKEELQRLQTDRAAISLKPVDAEERLSLRAPTPLTTSTTKAKESLPKCPRSFSSSAEAVKYFQALPFGDIPEKHFLEFLEALPPASNATFWGSKELLSPAFVDSLMAQFNKPGSSKLAVEAMNALVGMAYALKAANIFDKEGADERMNRLLGFFEAIHPNLRMGHPLLEKRAQDALDVLKKLGSGKPIPYALKLRFWVEDEHFSRSLDLEKHPCSRNIKKRRAAGLEDKLDHFLVLLPHLLFATVRSPHELRESSLSPTFRLEENTFKISLEGFRPLKEQSEEILEQPDEKPQISALFHALFPFTPEEELIVRQLLDNRFHFQRKYRSTQNHQIKISRKALHFGKTEIPPEEFEQLLSISLTDKTVIPQCLHYFSPSRFFFRLQDPRFQALLHGFLLTNGPDGKGSLLNQALNEDPLLAKRVVEFLQEGIAEAQLKKWPETELFLLLLMGQCSAYLQGSSKQEELQKQLFSEMEKSILHLQKNAATIFEKNRLDYWLVALAPFLAYESSSKSLKELCKEACHRLDKTSTLYDFDGRLIIKDYFDSGLKLLSKGESSLPRWVFGNTSYKKICQDKEPYIEILGEGEFRITTHEGAVYFLSVREPHLKISREFQNQRFLYVPTLPVSRNLFGGEEMHWWSLEKFPEKEAIAFSLQGDLRCHVIEGEAVHPKQSNLVLASAKAQNLPLIQRLSKLDNPGETLAWKDKTSGEVVKIELPHYGLIFDRHINSDGAAEWRCAGYPGFVLDCSAVVSELEPFSCYFVLKKDGTRHVFFPNRHLDFQKSSLGGTPPATMRAQKPRLFSLSLTEQGKLLPPKDSEVLLHLIHISLNSHQYPQAAAWIERLARIPSYWGAKEHELVGPAWLNDRDSSPYACALRVRLRLLAEKSGGVINTSLLEDEYRICLDQRSSLGDDWLSLAEERQVLSLLPSRSSLLEIRRAELESDEPLSLETIEKGDRLPAKEAPSCICFSPEQLSTWVTPTLKERWIKGATSPTRIALLLRPDQALVDNFLSLYSIAYKREPLVPFKDLATLLRASRTQDSEVETARTMLLGIAYANDDEHALLPSPEKLLEHVKKSPSSGIDTFAVLEVLQSLRSNGLKYLSDLEMAKPTPPKDREELEPKAGIIRLAPSAPLASTSSVTGTFDLSHSSLKATPVRPLKVLLEKRLLVEQALPLRQKAIEEEIALLKEMQDLYPAQEEASRLVEGLEERRRALIEQREDPDPLYLLPITVAQNTHTKQQLTELEALLAVQINESGEEVSFLEKEILALANKRSIKSEGEVYADLIKPLSLRKLLLHFAKGNEAALLKSNPELAPHLEELKTLLTDYAVAQTDLQHFIRSQRLLFKTMETAQKTGWGSEATQHAAAAFVTTITQERVYEPQEKPKLLLFEAIGDVRLRQDQYEALLKLSDSEASYELEARTGFGKSKVLLPLWLFLNQQPERLTLMVTTRSLLPDQLLHLRELLGEDLEMTVQVVDFDRKKMAEKEYFNFVVKQIEDAKAQGHILLVDINSLHGMTHLALKQLLFKEKERNISKLDALLEIRALLKSAFVFIDESTECLGVRKRFDYASGSPQPIESSHCQQAATFYDQVVLSPEVLSACHLEFLADLRPGKQLVTTDNYNLQVRPMLVKAALRYLKVPEKYSKAVTEHFLEKESSGAEEYFKTLNPKDQKRYAYCYHQIATYLKRSLARRCGVRYDCNAQRIAIPYQESTPRPDSEFANREDLINFTIQANLKRPLDLKTIEAFFHACEKEGPTSPSYQLFLELKKTLSLPAAYACTEAEKEKVLRYLNSASGHRDRLTFIGVCILPKISTIPSKIPGDLYSILGSLRHVHATSGTVAPETLPPKIESLQKKSALTENILSLWKNSKHPILTLDTKDGKTFLKELLKNRPEDRVLIDIGGLLRDLTQEEIVRLIFAETEKSDPPIRGITFYNNERVCMMWERGALSPIPRENSRLPKEETYTYIRQGHAVGSDTPMSETAQGTATVSRETEETLFLQGVGRMRGLQTGQKENFVISEEDAQIIRHQVGLKEGAQVELRHLLAYVQKVELAQKQKDKFFAIGAYLNALLEEQLWKGKPVDIINAQSLLTDTLETDPTQHLFDSTLEIPVEEALDKLYKNFLSRLESESIEIDTKALYQAFTLFVKRQNLKGTIAAGQAKEEEVSETELEVTQETSMEIASDVGADFSFRVADPEAWNGDYRSLMKEKGTSLLGLSLLKSPNLERLERHKHSDRCKRAYQYVVKIGKKGITLLALDLHDMECALQQMRKETPRDKVSYFMLSADGKILAAEGTRSDILISSKEKAQIGVLTKLLAGDSQMNDLEMEWLKTEFPKLSASERNSFLRFLRRQAKSWPQQNQIKSYLSSLDEQAKAFDLPPPPPSKVLQPWDTYYKPEPDISDLIGLEPTEPDTDPYYNDGYTPL